MDGFCLVRFQVLSYKDISKVRIFCEKFVRFLIVSTFSSLCFTVYECLIFDRL